MAADRLLIEGRLGASGQPSRVRWLVLALACGTSALLYLHRYTWNFIAPKLREEYGWSLDEVQFIYTFFNWTYGLGQIPSGLVLDRVGPRLFLGAAILLWTLAVPLQALRSQAGILVARLTLGAAQSGAYPGLASVTEAWFPLAYRTRIQGLVATVCGRGGGALSPIIMATVLMAWCGLSWRMALVVLSGAGVAFGVAFLALFRGTPEQDPRVNLQERLHIRQDQPPGVAARGPSQPALPWHHGLRCAARLPSIWFLVGMQAFVAGVDSIYSSLLGDYFQSRNVALAKAGLLASLPLFGGMAGGLVAAGWNDWLLSAWKNRRWARSAIGCVSNLLAAAAMLVMIRQETAFAAACWLGIVKFFADMSQPTVWGASTDLGGRRFSATVFSIMNTGGILGAVGLPILFGKILSASRTVAVIEGVEQKDYVPMFLVAALIYVLAGLAWLPIDCRKPVEEAAPPPGGDPPAATVGEGSSNNPTG